MATTWGYKTDSGEWQQADPFATPGTQSADQSVDFPLETYRKAAGVAYEYSKKKLEDVTSQQQTLTQQKADIERQNRARDYQHAQQAYRY